jgi:hypothetical protein
MYIAHFRKILSNADASLLYGWGELERQNTLIKNKMESGDKNGEIF